MMTWQIMIGAQLISVLVSAGVVVSFMLKKEPLDAGVSEKEERIPAVGTLAHTTA